MPFGESSNLSVTTMTTDEISKYLVNGWDDWEFLLAVGFEEAFVGVVYGKGRSPVACYDRETCIDVIMKRDDISEDEAEEFFSFNVDDAWGGDATPMFLRKP